MHHSTDRITHTSLCYTSCEALAGMRNSSVSPPLRNQSDDPSYHEQTIYHGATSCSHTCIYSWTLHTSINVKVILNIQSLLTRNDLKHFKLVFLCLVFLYIKNRKTKPEDEKKVKVQSRTHCTIHPTHAPAWEEMITMELDEKKAPDESELPWKQN